MKKISNELKLKLIEYHKINNHRRRFYDKKSKKEFSLSEFDRIRSKRSSLSKEISSSLKEMGLKIIWGDSGNMKGILSIKNEKNFYKKLKELDDQYDLLDYKNPDHLESRRILNDKRRSLYKRYYKSYSISNILLNG